MKFSNNVLFPKLPEEKPTVLVVDDSKTVVSLIKRLIESEFNIIPAYSGVEALEKYREIKPALILLDVDMPGMNGFEVCRRIKEMDGAAFTPIIFVTGQKDIESLTEGLNSGGEDYLTKPFNPRELKARINAAIRTRTLLYKLEMANAHIEKERDIIAQLQKGLLPDAPPEISGFKFFCDYQPSSKAGGDYYDFINIDDQYLGVIVMDVSGHGTPAAVIMAMARMALRTHLAKIRSPKAALEKLNKILCENIAASDFITAFYGMIHIPTRVMTYASAGHNPPLFFDVNNNSLEELTVDYGFPLMIRPTNKLEERLIQLTENSKLILYTDGLTEARNEAGELFGVPRLKKSILEFGKICDAAQLGQRLMDDIIQFTNDVPFVDDYTLVVIEVD